MNIHEIEQSSEVKSATQVLKLLEGRGIKEPAIAAGWTRSLISGGSTADIDVSYVGGIHFEDARIILEEVLDEINPENKAMWDTKGIWNAEIAYGVKHTVDNFLLYYLNSIDSVYLASDEKLHDPTGYGFEDAETKTLRINDYDITNRSTTPSEEVNVCLENCRRLAKFGWTPTERTVERISKSVGRWNELTEAERSYFINKLATKYPPEARLDAKATYDIYGWGFIFDL